MLRITQQNSPHGAKTYFATADYYSEGQEIVGLWGGKAATMLGLEGTVDKRSFDMLCDNLDPRNGQRLTARTSANRTVGYDFTFSAPKSVSLLYGLTQDQKILGAFRSAVAETMNDIEADMKTRVRKGGKDSDRLTGNMVYAEYIHFTSRPIDNVADPQLHGHCFAPNITFDQEEQRFKAGQFRDLKADAPYFQAAFRVRLANKLQDLGFGIERKRDDFEIAGISSGILKRYSRRTEQIEQVAAEEGITDPKKKAELGAKTREKKTPHLSWDELRQNWSGRLSQKERDDLAAVYSRKKAYTRQTRNEAQAVDHALEHSFVKEAVVPERKLLTEAFKRGLGTVTVEDTQKELAHRPLLRGDLAGRPMATTQSVLAEEERLIAFARNGRGRCRPLGDRDIVFSREWLNEGQKNAIRHVVTSRDRVVIIRGAAGTGKTSLMQEAAEKIEDAGHNVIPLAPSVNASFDVLRNEGFGTANTVAYFLKNRDMQEDARGQVIWLDEAGLLGSRDMARLFDLAGELNCRLVLSGDRKQHRSVARGEPLKLLEERAGLPVVEVSEILRQSGDYREAVRLLSEDKIAEGFAKLDEMGCIREVADDDRYKQLADAYLQATRERKRDGKSSTALVVSPTHAEGARIVGRIRAALKKEGKLGDERALTGWVAKDLTDAEKRDSSVYDPGDLIVFHQNVPGHKAGSHMLVAEGQTLPLDHPDRFVVYRPSDITLAVGDRARATANFKTKDGKRVSNGSLFTVKGFTARGDIVTDRGWLLSKDFLAVTQGYCVTSHSSQGKSVDTVIVGQSSESFPASNRRQGYVSYSRGKNKLMIFTDNKQALLEAIQRADEPLSATEFMQRQKPKLVVNHGIWKRLSFMRRLAGFEQTQDSIAIEHHRNANLNREKDYGR